MLWYKAEHISLLRMAHQTTGFGQDTELFLGDVLLPTLLPDPIEPTALPFVSSSGPTSMDLNYSPEHLAVAHGAGDRGFSDSLHSPFVRLRCATMGISQHYLDILWGVYPGLA